MYWFVDDILYVAVLKTLNVKAWFTFSKICVFDFWCVFSNSAEAKKRKTAQAIWKLLFWNIFAQPANVSLLITIVSPAAPYQIECMHFWERVQSSMVDALHCSLMSVCTKQDIGLHLRIKRNYSRYHSKDSNKRELKDERCVLVFSSAIMTIRQHLGMMSIDLRDKSDNCGSSSSCTLCTTSITIVVIVTSRFIVTSWSI